MKEEGLTANPVKPPSCENKESLESAILPSRDDVIEETFTERDAAKDMFRSEVGDRDVEEPGDRRQAIEASVALKNGNAESLKGVEEDDLVPAGKVEDELISAEENTEDDDVDEDEELTGYSCATIDGQWEAVQGVMVKKKP